MSDYMKVQRAALLAHIQRGAVPDIAEVERLVSHFGDCAPDMVEIMRLVDAYEHAYFHSTNLVFHETRNNLLDAVRAIVAERDEFRDAAKMVPDGWKLVSVTSQGVQFGNAWYSHESITGYDAQRLNSGACRMTARQYMDWVREARAAAPQPVGEVPMPEPSLLSPETSDGHMEAQAGCSYSGAVLQRLRE